MNNNQKPSKKRKSPDNNISPTSPKRVKTTSYYGNFDASDFKVNSITELINLGFRYNQDKSNTLIHNLFKIIPPLIKLDKMIGMSTIKKQLINQIIYFIQGFNEHDLNGNMLHCTIEGPPGCGKTIVASIIAEIYNKLGFLSTKKITIGKRVDFIAKYVGQTVNKTMDFLDKAKGGVLIIDEIYTLGQDDTFSQEAIDTINQFLSENKADFICIVVGYRDKIQSCFFDKNKGLSRRFPYRFSVDHYTNIQLLDIFKYQIKTNNWFIDDTNAELKANLLLFFNNKEMITENGGDTELLFTICKTIHANNSFGKILSNELKYQLDYNDINTAIEQFIELKNKIKTHQGSDSYKLMFT